MDHEGTLTFKGQGLGGGRRDWEGAAGGERDEGVPRPGNLGGAVSRTQGVGVCKL